MTKILITGGAGFCGSHLVEHVLRNTDWHVTVLDRLTYASHGLDRLRDIKAFDNKRVDIFTADLAYELGTELRREIGEPDYFVHMAAETHVDNSIADPWPFIQSNLVGTYRMLELARSMSNLQRMIVFGTDESMGPAPKGVFFQEWDRYNSTNPYSATKSGAEELALAWANTYKVPVVISKCMNIFGERQHAEKFIPLAIKKILDNQCLLIHTNDQNEPGSRFYIHARNVAAACLFLLERGEVRDKYNIMGEREVNNLEMAKAIAAILGKELRYELTDFQALRPGHDFRYALDGTKMANMGWQIPVNFDESLRNTVLWTARPENSRWLRGK